LENVDVDDITYTLVDIPTRSFLVIELSVLKIICPRNILSLVIYYGIRYIMLVVVTHVLKYFHKLINIILFTVYGYQD